MGFTSALTYDFEVFSTAQDSWLKSSVSNFETFQANRLKLRLKTKMEKSIAHTLNGSHLTLPEYG
jgi:seryl-tRNA synthetase